MSKILSNQLKMVTSVDLSDVPSDFHVLVIDKQQTLEDVDLNVGQSFLIELEDYIINPPPNFTLSDNWNGGSNPTQKYMRVIVVQVMGKMVRVQGVGFDMKTHENIGDVWEGWLPRKSIKVKKVLFNG